ncbi:hypothetical protein L1887_41838 [Cichorium endivia]|nr:hypothetical protein L1887_41838 [Cichorium endivia]
MDQEELHATLKRLYYSVTSSSSSSSPSFSSTTMPMFIYNMQDSTFHGRESFSQQNNKNQTYNRGNNSHLHTRIGGSSSTITTCSSPIVSINAYDSQNLTFQGETSWPPFLSENNRRRTYDSDNNWDRHDFVKTFSSSVDPYMSTKATTNTNIINITNTNIITNTPVVHLEPYIPQKSMVQKEENDILQPNHVDIIEEFLHDPFDPFDPFDFPKLQIPCIPHNSMIPPHFVPKESLDLSYQNHHHPLLHREKRSPSISTSIGAKSVTRSKTR